MIRRPPRSTRTDTLFPYTTLFRSGNAATARDSFVAPPFHHPGSIPPALREWIPDQVRDDAGKSRGRPIRMVNSFAAAGQHRLTALRPGHGPTAPRRPRLVRRDRKSVVSGKSESVRV